MREPRQRIEWALGGGTVARQWWRFTRRELLGSTLTGVVVAFGTVTVPVAFNRSVSEAAVFFPWVAGIAAVLGLLVGAIASLLALITWGVTRDCSIRTRVLAIGICGVLSVAPLALLAGSLMLPTGAAIGALAVFGLIAGAASAGNAYCELRQRPWQATA